MNLLFNQLKQLQKENKSSIAEINSKVSKTEIDHIIRYLSAHSLPTFQIEVIRKDLAGMALEADIAGVTLAEKLGITEKEFCDAIIESADSYPAKRERLFQELINVIQFMTGFYILEYFMIYSAPTIFGISLNLVLWSLIYFCIIKIGGDFMRNRLSLHESIWMRHLNKLAAVIGLFMYMVITIMLFQGKSLFFIQGNGFLILIILLLAVFISQIGLNAYDNHCSLKYNY